MIFKIKKEVIDKYAIEHGYTLIDWQENIGMVSYLKDFVRINVYLSTLTVSTAMNHPKQGRTQLFRKNLDIKTLKRIFRDPRAHTGKGYYKKKI